MPGMRGMARNKISTVTLTPEQAAELLESNTLNRPLSDAHVHRIARQIIDGKWRYNGDTIKVADTGDVLDGQHRLWAVIEAKRAVETIIVHGIQKEAFATIDTLRKPRSASDIVALSGQLRHRKSIAMALTWLLRYQHKCLLDYRAPNNRIENSDIEEAFRRHPQMLQAVERTKNLRRLGNVPIIAFMYYVLANRNQELADRMVNTLEDPAGVGIMDPFYALRAFFTADHLKQKDPIVVIACIIKAINAAHWGHKIKVLSWKNHGKNMEDFPALEV